MAACNAANRETLPLRAEAILCQPTLAINVGRCNDYPGREYIGDWYRWKRITSRVNGMKI